MDYKKAHDSVRREILYSILIEFGVPVKLVRLTKMHLNETCNKVHMYLLLFIFALEYTRPGKLGGTEIKWYISAFGIC
jgi:hypothetical protein